MLVPRESRCTEESDYVKRAMGRHSQAPLCVLLLFIQLRDPIDSGERGCFGGGIPRASSFVQLRALASLYRAG